MSQIGEHAIVLGASLAGLAAAAAMARRFHRVTIIERDQLPRSTEPRRGVPQGRHATSCCPQGASTWPGCSPG